MMRVGVVMGVVIGLLATLALASCDDEEGADAVDVIAADAFEEEPADAVDEGAEDEVPALVSVSGDVIPFNVGPDARLEGAVVSVVEHPEMSVTTGANGHFRFDGLEAGSRVTLRMTHPDYHPIQTGTLTLTEAGAERVTFQAVTHGVYSAMAGLLGMEPDEENACQMVTTVTRVGKSLYDEGAHGEEGATVTLEPALPAEHGPIYFNSDVIPDRSLSETSDDGGVLFIQVPPGEYVWTANKAGVEFTQVRMICEPGWLVNASPPWGLQALE